MTPDEQKKLDDDVEAMGRRLRRGESLYEGWRLFVGVVALLVGAAVYAWREYRIWFK